MRVLPLVGLTLSVAAVSAVPTPAQAAGTFGCSASAARITVLGQKIEPVSANAGAATCAAVTKTLTGPAAGLPAPLSAGALVSATQLDAGKNVVSATGGIADLAVGALPTLPIKLPQVAVPDAVRTALANALKGTTVDLRPVKSALSTALSALPIGTVLPTSILPRQLGGAVGGVTGVVGGVTGAVGGATGGATNPITGIVDQVTGAVGQVTTGAGATALLSSIPDTVTLSSLASVDQLLAGILPALNLPNVELLHVRGAMAYASGQCTKGTPGVTGSSQVAGIKVLGQDLPVGEVVDKVLSLIDSSNIDLSKITLPTSTLGLTAQQTALIGALAPAQAALDSALATASNTLHTALAAVPPISIPASIAEVKVTPGQQVKNGDSITQQALTISVTVAGQPIVDAVIGEAMASLAGVQCGSVVKPPVVKPPVINPNTPTGATLECTKRNLVLVDVLERSTRVKLTGVANPKLAGKTVSIVFGATGNTVAHARVHKNGSFHTTAPLPRQSLRASDAARYTARVGKQKSLNLKLRRRMIIRSMTSHNGYVTIKGTVVKPLSTPLRSIKLSRRVSCNQDRVVKRFHPHPDGRFSVTVKAPKGVGTAVYRMTTKVLDSSSGRKLFETFTLPRAVDLHR